MIFHDFALTKWDRLSQWDADWNRRLPPYSSVQYDFSHLQYAHEHQEASTIHGKGGLGRALVHAVACSAVRQVPAHTELLAAAQLWLDKVKMGLSSASFWGMPGGDRLVAATHGLSLLRRARGEAGRQVDKMCAMVLEKSIWGPLHLKHGNTERERAGDSTTVGGTETSAQLSEHGQQDSNLRSRFLAWIGRSRSRSTNFSLDNRDGPCAHASTHLKVVYCLAGWLAGCNYQAPDDDSSA